MKKFKVTAHYITYLYAEIEAEDIDEAWKKAKEMDGGQFKQCQDVADDWSVDDVYEPF